VAKEAGIKASRRPGVRSLLDNVTRKRPTVSRVASQSLAMATKETGDQRSAGWTARYNRRGRAESADRMSRRGIGVSDGQDREAPPFSTIPADARDNESCQEYSQSLRQDADDTSVNLGTSSDYPTGVREPEPVSQTRGGASYAPV
jgi:hypothetical protein